MMMSYRLCANANHSMVEASLLSPLTKLSARRTGIGAIFLRGLFMVNATVI